MIRTVTGTLLLPSGNPPPLGSRILFELTGGFDAVASYLGSQIVAYTNDRGKIGVLLTTDGEWTEGISLWCNQESLSPSAYRCQLPDGSSFNFDLPAGDGAIDLSQLRIGGDTDDGDLDPTPTADIIDGGTY